MPAVEADLQKDSATTTPLAQSLKRDENKSFIDQLFYIGFLTGGALLSCGLGMMFAVLDLKPYQVTEEAFVFLSSLKRQYEFSDQEYPEFLWTKTDRTARGVTTYHPEQVSPGWTLYSSAHESSMILIDHTGEEAHRWEANYRDIWGNKPGFNAGLAEQFVHMRRGHVFENGDLLVLYETPFLTPNGLGLAKLNRESQILWTFDKHTHHDFDVAPDGTIFTLSHRILNEPHPEMSFLGSPIIDDCLSIITADGREQKTFSLMSSVGRSPYCLPRTIQSDTYGDSFHSNTVHVIDDRFASHYPAIEAGDVLICARDLNLVFVVHPDSEEVVWATTGPWHHPHDPDPLPNGNLLIFDNCFARGDFSGSRILEFDPRTGQIEWEFAGNHENQFASDLRGCQQRLPNGNVLITESTPGRLLEVTSEGDIVWEFVNPVRGGEHGNMIPIVIGAQRLSPSHLPFLSQSSSVQPTPRITGAEL